MVTGKREEDDETLLWIRLSPSIASIMRLNRGEINQYLILDEYLPKHRATAKIHMCLCE